MRTLIVLLFVIFIASVRAQFFGSFESLGGFRDSLDSSLSSARDPRQNRGPVVFPPAPADNGETSGVVVGASGYGFVPPDQKYRSPFFIFF